MNIALDISPLQGPHRYRGVGATIVNFVNHISKSDKKKHSFIFYVNEKLDYKEVLQLLALEGVRYTVRTFSDTSVIEDGLQVTTKVNRLKKAFTVRLRHAHSMIFGDTRISNFDNIDHFIIFDQLQVPPKKSLVRSTVILYDAIPYVLEHEYLWSYQTARNKGRTRKSALRCAVLRYEYAATLRAVCRKATQLIAISQHTKNNFIRYIGVSSDKIDVCLLGVNETTHVTTKPDHLYRYIQSSWGSLETKSPLPDKPFLLYVGGADARRRIVDLLAAYVNLRGEGQNIALVLAGDTMLGPDMIPNVAAQEFLKDCSYQNDIYFLGYVDLETRGYLYSTALAFVYPSIYEGFGLPILEAMQHGTPVITYKNSSIEEVSGNVALYANNHNDIADLAKDLLNDSKKQSVVGLKSKQHAQQYTWQKTVNKMIDLVTGKYEKK